MTWDPVPARELHRLGMVNELHPPDDLMRAARAIADKIASNSPTAVQSVKRAVQLGEGQPVEQAIAITTDAHGAPPSTPIASKESAPSTTAASRPSTTPTSEAGEPAATTNLEETSP